MPSPSARHCSSSTGSLSVVRNSRVSVGVSLPRGSAVAKALKENTPLSPTDIVKKALAIAGQLCIYTNQSVVIETLE